ncbi:hypothetical protein ACWFPQ_19190 [Peribacillus butanolivorans]
MEWICIQVATIISTVSAIIGVKIGFAAAFLAPAIVIIFIIMQVR